MSGARFTVAPEVCDRVPGLVVVVAWATGVDGNVAWVPISWSLPQGGFPGAC